MFNRPANSPRWMLVVDKLLRILMILAIAVPQSLAGSVSVARAAVAQRPQMTAGSTRIMCENDLSLVGCWRMEEGSGTTLQDGGAAPYNDATLLNSPTFTKPGQIGASSLLLDGTNDYASTGDEDNLDITTNRITLAAWIKTTVAVPSTQYIIKKNNTTTNNPGYELSLASTGKVFVRFNNNATYRLDSLKSYPLTSTWIHVAATFDGSNIKIYYDGIENNSISGAGLTIGANPLPLAIGTYSGGGGSYFKGNIDDARVYNRDLSASEIAILAGTNPPGDNKAPEKPSALTATPGNTTVGLSWTSPADPDVKGYNVYRSTSPGVPLTSPINGGTLVTTEAYIDTGRVNGQIYYYVVTAVDTSALQSGASNEVFATPDDAPPAAPTSLTATGVTGAVNLSWTAPADTDLAGYNIYRGTAAGFTPGTPLNGALITGTSYSDATGAVGTTYYYVVKAQDTSGNLSPVSNEAFAAPLADTTPPAVPTGLTAARGDQRITLTWTANTEPDKAGYNVYQYTAPSTYTKVNTNLLTSPTYLATELTNGSAYSYVVTCVDNLANESAYSSSVSATPAELGLQFDGTDDYVTFGEAPTLGAQTFTLEAWVNRSATNGKLMGTGTAGLGENGLPQAYPIITKGRGQGETPLNINMNYWIGLTSTGIVAADFEDNNDGLNHPVLGTRAIPTGEWHHIAVTFGGGCWTIYVDGVVDALNAGVSQCPKIRNSTTVSAVPESTSQQHAALGTALQTSGTLPSDSGYFSGKIDEARVWNVARTQGEILATINSEVTSATGLLGRWGMEEGTGTKIASPNGTLTNGPTFVDGAPFNIAPPTAPAAPTLLSATSTVGLQINLAWQDNSNNETSFKIERSPDGSTGWTQIDTTATNITTYANIGLASATQYCYRVRASNGIGDSAPSNVSCATTPGEFNNALDFGSSNAYASFGNPAQLGLAQFTLETWFKRDGAGVSVTTGGSGITNAIPLITKGTSDVDNQNNRDINYFLGINADTNKLIADFEEGAGGTSPSLNHPISGTTSIAIGTWYHAAASYDGTTWKLYLNGNEEATLSVGQPVRADNTSPFALGTSIKNDGTTLTAQGFFDGTMDEVRVWNTARTQTEIQGTLNSPITDPQIGLVGRWGMNETSGTAVAGSAGTGIDGTITGIGSSWVSGAPSITNHTPQLGTAAPVDGASGVVEPVNLSVNVSDADLDNLTVKFYGRQKAPDFTLIAIPDPQYYAKTYPSIYNAQMNWVVGNKTSSNIKFVMSMGDNVDSSTTYPGEFTNATTAWDILTNGGVPYGLALGNHDGAPSSTANFNTAFGTRIASQPTFGGRYNSDYDNSYSLFSASGMDFIVLFIEYDGAMTSTTHPVLVWANGILAANSNRRAIVVSHNLLDDDSTFSTQGGMIYDALKANPNLFLMLGGHLDYSKQRKDGNVYSLRADFQTYLDQQSGYLREMRFSPIDDKIYITTTSPLSGVPDLVESTDQFSLDYPMDGFAFTQIGTDQIVLHGNGTASVSWTGLAANKDYEWYAVVTDDVVNSTLPTRSFTTAVATIPPVITEGDSVSVTLSEDGSPDAFSLTLNATDADAGDTLTWSISTPAAHGTASASGTGTSKAIGYVPAANFNGVDSFVVRVSDGKGGVDTITVNVTITPFNDAPVVTNPGRQTSSEGAVVSLQIAASDIDLDTLTYSASGLPPALAISPTTGLISGTIGNGIVGNTYPVTVTVTDGAGGSTQVAFDWGIANTLPPSGLTCVNLQPKPMTASTGEKPQSKVWTYNGTWYAVFPTSAAGASSAGTWLWRLQGTAWVEVLKLSDRTDTKADVKASGNLAHILLYAEPDTQFRTVEFVGGTVQFWTGNANLVNISLPGSEIATIDKDSTGRIWLATRQDSPSPAKIVVYYSDAPYTSFQGPVEIASGVTVIDDISVITAMPGNKMGILWSNQNTKRFGFRVHTDGADPTTWSADELPASQSAIDNVGTGMADDHLNVAVAADGTLYAAVKTGYDTAGYPKMALLVRRPNGTWDNLYAIDEVGTRPLILLDEVHGHLTMIHTQSEGFTNIVYRQSITDPISFGTKTTLRSGLFNDVSSMKANYTDAFVVIYASSTQVEGQLCAPTSANSANLYITKTDNRAAVRPNDAVTYTITAGNTGPQPVTGATISDTLPAALTNATWTCSASGIGASCAASGNGSINELVNLPMGATVNFTVNATLNPGASGTLDNSASITPPGGITDPITSDNSATDSDVIVTPCAADPTLVGCWQMEENGGTVLIDGSSFGNDAGLTGTPAWVDGKINKSLSLDGLTYAIIPHNPTLGMADAISLAAWVKPTINGTQYIIKKGNRSVSPPSGFELSLATASGSTGAFFFRINDNSTCRVDSNVTYNTYFDNWVHVAATYDKETLHIYVNGVLVDDSSTPCTVPIEIDTTKDLAIGSQSDGGSRFTGWLDDVRIYNRALSLSEIQLLAGVTPPTITSNGGGDTATVSVAENSTAVTTVTASDPDAGASLTYSISGGADAARFTINTTTGALSFVTAPNFESPTDAGGNNVYDVVVQVSDGSLMDSQAIAVTVTDVSEAASCLNPPNEIYAENCLPGNPPSEWDVNGAGDANIQGYATDISVNQGQTVFFKVDTDATDYRLDIYRMGYYNGDGARKVATVQPSAALPQNQPACSFYADNGNLLDCGNWALSASWAVPANATSGIYIAKLVREDGTMGASHITFIVRDDDGHSDLLFQTSDTTWQAYNGYGDYSLYAHSQHAHKVSYNRPFLTRTNSTEDFWFNAEYPMLRWLERNGYDVSYFTDIDSDRNGGEILEHKVFLSVGHDEYWSAGQRSAVEAARAAGVNLAFFSGNEIYWKTRWENSTEGSSTPYRTLVSYKEGDAQGGEHYTCYGIFTCDPNSTVWTGLWRQNTTGHDGGRPENALSGQISWVGTNHAIQVAAEDGKMRFWRNTSVAALAAGTTTTLAANTLGYEWDFEQYQAYYPTGRIWLSTTFADAKEHHLSLYRHSSGALVFGAGTVQWMWGLDTNHDRGAGTDVEDPRMQQATVNLFADMGAQPTSLQSGLVAAAASTDTTPPTSTITSPAGGTTVNGNVIISGTASGTGGAVGGVEVSVDGGLTWQHAAGHETWTFSWTPTAIGSVTIKTRAVDDSGNIETPSAGITVTVEPRTCPCSLWDPANPAGPEDNDTTANEVGVKFRTDLDGWVTAIRFYKHTTNTGTHLGNLWSASGTNLGSVIFTGETASGWQEAVFSTPVAITAGTTYVASYFGYGHYAATEGFFTAQGVDNAPLHALRAGVDGPNGVYIRSDSSAFPTVNWNNSNYWVDVVFVTAIAPDTTPPTVISTSPTNNATNVAHSAVITVTFNEAMTAASISGTTFELRDASTNLVPAVVTYDAGTRRAVLTPGAALTASTLYTATIKGGTDGVADLAGNKLVADTTWSFTTAAPPPLPPDEGPGGPILVVGNAAYAANPFGRYYAEILRAEGFNAYYVMDIANVTAAILTNYKMVLLGETPLTTDQISMFDTWVSAGGNLIAFKPAKTLAGLYGLTEAAGTTTEGYMAVNTATSIGQGVVADTLQIHGTADHYTLSGATALGTLYSNATTTTAYPAITRITRGNGQVVIFTFDLARSIVLMRQGNPAWAGQEGDGVGGIRAGDMFVGRLGQPNWIDNSKLLIPQADEQMHVLSHAIEQLNASQLPLPRLWYFPNQGKGALIMTGDSEGCGYSCMNAPMVDAASYGGTYTVYMQGTQATPAEFDGWMAAGHGVAPHYDDTANADNPTVANMTAVYDAMTQAQIAKYGVAPRTARNHWVVWTGWSEQAEIEAAHGIGLDTNYYHWGSWLGGPGYFTGSGLPMRFSDENGHILDIFQATTQLPDETWGAGNIYNVFKTLVDRSIDQGYYGFLTANFHPTSYGTFQTAARQIMTYANQRSVPIWSAEKALDFLQARNQARTQNLSWNGSLLSFNFNALTPYAGLTLMLPARANGNNLLSLTRDGTNVSFNIVTVKGYDYALFTASNGAYVASYQADTTLPTITARSPEAAATKVPVNANVTVTFSEDINETTITSATFTLRADGAGSDVPAGVTYNALTKTATLNPNVDLAYEKLYTVTVSGSVADLSNNQLGSDQTWSFTTQPVLPPTITDTTAANFNAGTAGACAVNAGIGDGAVHLGGAIDESFSGSSLPAGWAAHDWIYDSKSGIVNVTGGKVTVDGIRINPDPAAYAPGRSLEFIATFSGGENQHVGFGAGNHAPPDDVFNATPFFAFSTHGGSVFQARTYLSGSVFYETTIPGTWLGSPHLFRIDWTDTSVTYFIDGNPVPVATHTYSSPGTTLRPAISDLTQDGSVLTVDWMRMTPYTTPCTFTSRVLDAGGIVTWGTLSWVGSTPAGTSLNLSYRTGNTPTPDGSWSTLTPVSPSGAALSGTSHYIQYQAGLATTDTSQTPVLEEVTITHSAVIPDTTPPTVTTVAPASGAPDVTVNTTVAATFTEPINPASLNAGGFELKVTATNSPVAASISYNGTTQTATLTPTVPLAISTQYTATLKGGAGGVRDLTGNPLSADTTWTFTTRATTFDCPCSIWEDTATPAVTTGIDSKSVEVGVRFRSSVSGYITGLRFYKATNSTGPYSGNLWSNTETLLGTLNFSTLTSSGWQQATFLTPIAITADTTYVASYFAPNGNYAFTHDFFANGVDTPPLRALKNDEDGLNGVYEYSPTSIFPKQMWRQSNYWVDVIFDTVLPPDTTSPVISTINAAPGANGTTAAISWATDEAATSRVYYGTAADTLTQTANDAALVTSHSLSLNGLIPATTYYYRVGSSDAAGNSTTAPAVPASPLTFTTPVGSMLDDTAADFALGTPNACVVDAGIGNGALRLRGTIDEAFSGDSLPAGWAIHDWVNLGKNGILNFSQGKVSVDGIRINPDPVAYAPGRSLEFTATFSSAANQHVGFGVGDHSSIFSSTPIIIFSTKDGGALQARTYSVAGVFETIIPENWLNSPHIFRIDWTDTSATFFIDGTQKVSHAYSNPGTTLRPAISDLNQDGSVLSVDWMRMTPYASPCTFTSRVFDAGAPANWLNLSWNAGLPEGTSLAFSYRVGNTPAPDGSWTSFTPVPASGSAITGRGQYAQYQVTLTSSDPSQTPDVKDVRFIYDLRADTTPPTLLSRTPVPNATSVALTSTVSATFSELMSPIPAGALRLRRMGETVDLPAVVTLAGSTATLDPDADLDPLTTYQVILVGSVTDLAGNPLGADVSWVFTTRAVALSTGDTTTANFTAGTPGACVVDAALGDGAVRLPFSVDEGFTGTDLPLGWSGYRWPNGLGSGTWSVSGGSLTVNGTSVRYDTLLNPGTTLEFEATFTAGDYQHVGFGGGNVTYDGYPVAMFSTRGSTNTLYTSLFIGGNVYDITIDNSSALLGRPHRYRIDWKTTGFDFYVDGTLVSTRSNIITDPMRAAASEFTAGGLALSVDWMRMTPYASPCTFTSRVFDAVTPANWLDLSWTGTTPAGTSIAFETRSGGTNAPDGSWSDWQAVNPLPGIPSPNGRYLQYRATLATSAPAQTPVLEAVTLTYSAVVTPVITWSNPADILVGTALGAAQLNASASTIGTLVYTPPAGTILGVGTHTLRVDFTPTDAENFTSASKTVTLRVLATHSISLVPGWNLVSFNLHPTDTAISSVLASVAGKYTLVYAWNSTAQEWLKYDPTIAPVFSDLKNLDETLGFWINMTTADTLSVNGLPVSSNAIALKTGWNLVGYPASVNRVLPAGIAGLQQAYAYHAADTEDPWKLYDASAPSYANELQEMAPGWGYWVNVSGDSTWTVGYTAP